MAPKDYRHFKKEVTDAGCVIDESGLPHIGRIYFDGLLVSTFSVTHRKGSKKQVLDCYQTVYRRQLLAVKARDNR